MENKYCFCKKCNQEVLEDDFLTKRCQCKNCYNSYALNYYHKNQQRISKRRKELRKENKEFVNKKDREYYHNNRERVLINNKRSVENNKEKVRQRKKVYYQKNKESLNKKQKIYYLENMMSIKDRCKNYYHENKEKVLTRHRQPKGRFSGMKSKAKQRGLVFDLTFDDFMDFWQLPCFYCGTVIETIGIDRVDSDKGYILENCVSCCIACNISKMDMPLKEWLEKAEKLVERKKAGIFNEIL